MDVVPDTGTVTTRTLNTKKLDAVLPSLSAQNSYILRIGALNRIVGVDSEIRPGPTQCKFGAGN